MDGVQGVGGKVRTGERSRKRFYRLKKMESSFLRYGGYPCGLWTLFHTLTVSQAKGGGGRDGGGEKEDPHSVLLAMSGFVEHFFGCRDCARHFALMADGVDSDHRVEGRGKNKNGAIKSEVKTPRDAVLWLWKAHNRVNMVGKSISSRCLDSLFAVCTSSHFFP